MFLGNLSNVNLFILNCILLLIVLSIIFAWFFRQVRQVCEKASGFLILGQVTFLFLSWGCFIVIFLIFVYTREKISALSLILTIVVGFLGTITGILFNQDAIKKLYEDRLTTRDKRLSTQLKYFEELPILLKEIDRKDKEIKELKKKLR